MIASGRPAPPTRSSTSSRRWPTGSGSRSQQDIVHRDVKPSNIMVMPKGGIAKITDFGIARLPISAVKTMTGMILGSPRYMSPGAGDRQADRRALRHLLARRGALRGAGRQDAVRGRGGRRDGAARPHCQGARAAAFGAQARAAGGARRDPRTRAGQGSAAALPARGRARALAARSRTPPGRARSSAPTPSLRAGPRPRTRAA